MMDTNRYISPICLKLREGRPSVQRSSVINELLKNPIAESRMEKTRHGLIYPRTGGLEHNIDNTGNEND